MEGRGGVKRQWGGQKRRFSLLSVGIFSEPSSLWRISPGNDTRRERPFSSRVAWKVQCNEITAELLYLVFAEIRQETHCNVTYFTAK